MEYTDIKVGKTHDLRDGEMKQVGANGTELLLVRVNEKLHAVGAHCPHYGAPLVDGVLSGERIVCPWHHACFNATTGDLEEPPALDALPCYEVKIESDQVIVRVPAEMSDRRTPTMVKRGASDDRLFVIVGGGAAGYAAAQTLREDGFTGRVVLITREDRLPYDRPNLSKEYLQGKAQPEWLPLRSDEFFAEHDIEVIRGRAIESIDAASKVISFADSKKIVCDALLVATGAEPRRLPFASPKHENVFYLRSYADADALISAAGKEKRAIVIGSSFIGMEAASSLTERGCEVTVVSPEEVPFKKILGSEIGNLFQSVHTENRVRFKLGSGVAGFIGDQNVTAVLLENGEQLDADFVVVGVGVTPATGMVKGVSLHTDGGVIVDEYLRAADGVYVAGDVACFPNSLTGERGRIEHWRTAQQQGRIAAHNMVGRQVRYDSVPFFWTRQFDVGLLYVGHASHWMDIIFQGDVSARNFLAFYVNDDRVVAVAGMDRDREMAACEELMRLDRMPSPSQLKNDHIDVVTVLRDAVQAAGDQSGFVVEQGEHSQKAYPV